MPGPGLAIAQLDPPDNAGLAAFMPWDTGIPSRGRDLAITYIRPAIAGFRVTPRRHDTVGAVDRSQNVGRIPRGHAQGLAQCRKRLLQFPQAFGDIRLLPRGHIR